MFHNAASFSQPLETWIKYRMWRSEVLDSWYEDDFKVFRKQGGRLNYYIDEGTMFNGSRMFDKEHGQQYSYAFLRYCENSLFPSPRDRYLMRIGLYTFKHILPLDIIKYISLY